jgi:hypothetical protein
MQGKESFRINLGSSGDLGRNLTKNSRVSIYRLLETSDLLAGPRMHNDPTSQMFLGKLIEVFDMVAKLLTIHALLNKILEALVKFTRPISCSIHIGCPDTLIRRRSGVEVFPSSFI